MLRPVRLVIRRLGGLEVDRVEPLPALLLHVPPGKLLALGPGAALRIRRGAVVHVPAVRGPGKTPTEMRAGPVGAVGAARARLVVILLGEDAAIQPGAAGGRAVILELLIGLDLTPAGPRVAVHLLEHGLGRGLVLRAFDRMIPREALDRSALRSRAVRVERLETPAQVKHEPQLGTAVARPVHHL